MSAAAKVGILAVHMVLTVLSCKTPIISPQEKDQNCFGILGTDWFSMERQDNIRSRQHRVGREGMCVSTRSLPQQTPRSGCTPVIPLPKANTIDTNPDTGGRSSQFGMSQASTAMQGLSPSVYKQQPQRAETMPVPMAQPQQTQTVSNPQGRQQHISSEPRTTRTQQIQAGNSGGLVRRNALSGTRNVGMRGGAPSFVPAPATGVVSQRENTCLGIIGAKENYLVR